LVKEKLTLSVEKEVVEKAKNLGINISDITERVLKGYTSAEKPEDDLHEAYQKLFDSILPLLEEFDCSVKVAEGVDIFITRTTDGKEREDEVPVEVFLTAYGRYYEATTDFDFKDIRQIKSGLFLSPEEILSNLVNALAKSKEKRKEQMNEIMMAKRIIDAMSETLLKKEEKNKSEKG
jgi:hypothetical protein